MKKVLFLLFAIISASRAETDIDSFIPEADPFTITATAAAGGTISPAGAVIVNAGEDQAFVITADAGFYISDIHVDTVSVGPVSGYTFTNVSADHSIEAFFDTLGVITATAGPNGTISPSGPVIVGYGADQSFTITPNTGYHIDSVMVDGVKVDSSVSYTFTGVISDHRIDAFFSINTYTITASSGPNGTISPSGLVFVDHGNSQAFTITPAGGYHTDSVLVDGVRADSLASFTFTNISSNHSISAFFSINTYTIAATAGPNGTITPSGAVSVNHGSSQSFSIAPNTGFHIDSVIVDGLRTDSTTGYTFTNVTSGHSILAFFSINVYTITATAGPNGSITPSGAVNVTHGASRAFAIAPNTGYHIDSVVVDGVKTDSTTGYTFTGVTANHSISAFFSINTYTIAATAGPNGSIIPSGPVVVSHGASRVFTITPGVGYHVDSVLVDGVKTDSTTSYTFINVTSNHSIVSFFSINTFTITALAAAGGSISPGGAVVVSYGSNQSFSIIPATGHHIDSVVLDGVNLGAVTGYNFVNVSADHALNAYFSIDVFTITSTASAGGSISPSGTLDVNYGSGQSFSATPNTGYHIDSLVVDGINQGAVANYNFISITADHTIDAYFSIDVFTITATASSGGSISPSGVVGINYGGLQAFAIAPNTGYHIDSVLVDGVKVDSTTGYTITNVTADHTIDAYFSINAYTITATAGANGAISPSGIIGINYGGSQAFSITPNTGYHIDSVLVDGVKVDSTTGYTFTNVTADRTIAAFFSINAYTITATAGGNGSISPSGVVGINYGGSQAFVIAPNTGYHIDSVLVDGVKVDSTTGYTFTNVTADHTIDAYFSINAYTITAAAGANGTITPSGIIGINYGGSQAFSITPSTGYHIDSVLVDGVKVDSTTTYTFTNVTADHAIDAYFSINAYTITAAAGANGTITPSGIIGINYGGSQAFSITPSTGYHIDSVLVDGVKVDSTTTYTFTNVTADHAIDAFFSINAYTITATAGGNGSISPSGVVGINYGGSQAFSITPNTGYHIDSVLVDEVKVDSTTTYTFTNVTADHTIDAFFSINAYTITATAGANGAISPSGVVGINYGGSQAFVIAPNTGYHIDSVLVDGVRVDSTTSYTFINVTANHTIDGFYSINTYTLTAAAGAKGAISPSGAIVVDFGSDQVFFITSDEGYHVDSVLVDGANIGSPGSHTFTNITADHTIEAFFSINAYTITAAAGANGTITPSGIVGINYGGSQAFSITPNTGYHIDSVLVDGVKVDSTTGYTFANVTTDHTIDAFFSINAYTITATAGANGTISPSGFVGINYGGSQAFSITPNTGYHIDSVLVDGVKVDSSTGFTFNNVTADHTIDAFFSINTYAITATANANGTITPSGIIGINYGGSQAFSITPGTGYHIDSVLVDGVKVDSTTGYTFTNVTADHTIDAFFSINGYTITATAGANGAITPSGIIGINHGGSQAFSITPNTGYHIDSVLVDGVKVDSTASYTFSNVISSRTIQAFFSINSYTITATAGPNGTITPSGVIGINYGGSRAFTITPNTGYHVDSVVVDGGKVDSTAGYTFTNVTSDHTINVFFSINVYVVSASASPGGSIAPSGAIGVNHGADRSFIVIADPNHHLDSVLVDGLRVDSTTGYTFTNVTSAHTIQAFFSIDVYTITAAAGPNGSISPSGSVGVTYGSTRTFTVTPNTGYHIDSVRVDGLKVDSSTSYTFTNITTDHSIQAFFSINIYRIIATAGVHGSINPSGEFYLPHGSSQAFTVTPDPGYHVDSIVVNGVRLDSTTGYTHASLTSDLTVFAYFSINTYTITATAGPNGTITPSGTVTVNHNATRSFAIAPGTGYHLDSVLVDGVRVDSTTSYTFKFVIANHTIAAFFSVTTFTITADTAGHGTITPSGTVVVNYGANRTFTVAPRTGYLLDSMLVDGARVDSTTSFTFYSVTADHTIRAYFTIMKFPITTMAASNGSVNPSGTTPVNYGDSLSIVITPDIGYYVAEVLVDNVSLGPITGYTFRNVTTSHVLQAFFSTNAPPSAPRLVSPLDGDTIPADLLGTLRFSWKASADADPGDVLTYSVRLFGPAVSINAGGITDTAVILDLRGVLLAGSEYQWNVSVDDGSASVASPDTFSFRVNPSTGIIDAGAIPENYALGQNYPNPFNPATSIRFDLPERSTVSLKVYNLLGVEVREVVGEELMGAGRYRTAVDFSELPSGTYFFRLSARGEYGGEFNQARKMVLLK